MKEKPGIGAQASEVHDFQSAMGNSKLLLAAESTKFSIMISHAKVLKGKKVLYEGI